MESLFKNKSGDNERYISINEPTHRYITYLEGILIKLKGWYDNRCEETLCIPPSLYKSLCWLVYE